MFKNFKKSTKFLKRKKCEHLMVKISVIKISQNEKLLKINHLQKSKKMLIKKKPTI